MASSFQNQRLTAVGVQGSLIALDLESQESEARITASELWVLEPLTT
jgi:hypothetical protein